MDTFVIFKVFLLQVYLNSSWCIAHLSNVSQFDRSSFVDVVITAVPEETGQLHGDSLSCHECGDYLCLLGCFKYSEPFILL